MKTNDILKPGRRAFMQSAAAVLAMSGIPLAASGAPLKIGVVGSGRIGGTLGGRWVKAGHEVMFSSLDLEHDMALAAGLGKSASAGSPRQAAAFGEVLLFSVPYSALPQLGRDLGEFIRGKVVLDTCNPFPGRDGDMANEARVKGTGVVSPQYLPGARLVRAFNSVGAGSLQSEAHRADPKIAIALAADDQVAMQMAAHLVRDAGFEPVMVGGLARAKDFDPGAPAFGRAMTAAELRRTLGL
jgi:predicted dinucleotide-binding enzyme